MSGQDDQSLSRGLQRRAQPRWPGFTTVSAGSRIRLSFPLCGTERWRRSSAGNARVANSLRVSSFASLIFQGKRLQPHASWFWLAWALAVRACKSRSTVNSNVVGLGVVFTSLATFSVHPVAPTTLSTATPGCTLVSANSFVTAFGCQYPQARDHRRWACLEIAFERGRPRRPDVRPRSGNPTSRRRRVWSARA